METKSLRTTGSLVKIIKIIQITKDNATKPAKTEEKKKGLFNLL